MRDTVRLLLGDEIIVLRISAILTGSIIGLLFLSHKEKAETSFTM